MCSVAHNLTKAMWKFPALMLIVQKEIYKTYSLIRVALDQNRNAVFIRSTALCFILTVAIYSP